MIRICVSMLIWAVLAVLSVEWFIIWPTNLTRFVSAGLVMGWLVMALEIRDMKWIKK